MMDITRLEIDPTYPTAFQLSRWRIVRWVLTGKPPLYVGQQVTDSRGGTHRIAWVDDRRFGTDDGLESAWRW